MVDLGKLTELDSGLEVKFPATSDAYLYPADGAEELPDEETAAKAVADSGSVPSIWFVNFPKSGIPSDLLEEYMQNVLDYRCWASLIWWKSVYGNSQIPQDGSRESEIARSAYCAKVGTKHMKLTPWVAMQTDDNMTKVIDCKTTEFHTELITAVLKGFVNITPIVFQTLEAILDSLRLTIDQTSSSSQSKMIVCERYEYLATAKVIRSYIRLISFSVTQSMKHVHNAKKTSSHVKCTIDYNDYEATFNQKLWSEVAQGIAEEQLKAANDFVKLQTIDCEP
jgi:hypothetical protein